MDSSQQLDRFVILQIFLFQPEGQLTELVVRLRSAPHVHTHC